MYNNINLKLYHHHIRPETKTNRSRARTLTGNNAKPAATPTASCAVALVACLLAFLVVCPFPCFLASLVVALSPVDCWLVVFITVMVVWLFGCVLAVLFAPSFSCLLHLLAFLLAVFCSLFSLFPCFLAAWFLASLQTLSPTRCATGRLSRPAQTGGCQRKHSASCAG